MREEGIEMGDVELKDCIMGVADESIEYSNEMYGWTAVSMLR